jgi:hypothetical protein
MKIFILFLLFIHSLNLFAVEEKCSEEIKDFCSESPKKIICLYENYEKASVGCKEELDRASGVAKTSGIRGGGGLNAFGPVSGALGLMGVHRTIVRVSSQYAPEPTPANILSNSLHLSTPLYQHGTENLAASFTASRINFGSTRSFDDKKTPMILDRMDVGGSYVKRTGEGRSWGIRGSIGSASDKAFHSKDEIGVTLSAFMLRPGKSNDYWAYSVFVSNNSPILNYIPIPGFIYFHRTDKLTGMYGLPFMSVQWQPRNPWIFSFSLFLVNANLEAAYGQRNELQFFTGFSTHQQSFFLADRSEKRDRLFFQEKKLFAGVRSPVMKNLFGEFQFGESFDRKLSQGKSFNRSDFSSTLGRAVYAQVSLTAMF